MTVLFSDPVFQEHQTGHHVETPARLRSILARLEKSGLLRDCVPGTIRPLTDEEVLRIHDRKLLDRVRAAAEAGGGCLDPDTVVSPESFRVALLAGGAAAAAVDAVLAGPQKKALCLIRPPGHHATPHTSMGFCLFNNIALAAEHARRVHGLSRILIVDWDVHHGNGTQDIFYADAHVGFLSIHRYGHGFYPGTGNWDETGTGPGLGSNFNVPVRFGTGRRDYLDLFRKSVESAADKIMPELLLVSAGFDAHRRDPIGSLGLESEDFGEMTHLLVDVASTWCEGRLVSCLEGGYNLDALAESVQVHLEHLLH